MNNGNSAMIIVWMFFLMFMFIWYGYIGEKHELERQKMCMGYDWMDSDRD